MIANIATKIGSHLIHNFYIFLWAGQNVFEGI